MCAAIALVVGLLVAPGIEQGIGLPKRCTAVGNALCGVPGAGKCLVQPSPTERHGGRSLQRRAIFFVPVAQVDPGGATDQKLEVRRLLRQLNAAHKTERDAAEQHLAAMGEKVLDLLPPPNEKVPPEERVRVEQIRQDILRAMAKAAVQASTVTLHGDSLPLSKVLAAFQEQTGNKIVGPQDPAGAAGPDPTLKVDFDKTPFWQALDQVLDQAGLSAYPFGEQKAIVLQPRLPGQTLRASGASYRGPFRFEAVQVEGKRDLRNPANKALVVTLEAAWEPRLAPIVLEEPLKKVVAMDDAGGPLSVVGAEAKPEIDVTPESMAKLLTVPLALPPRDVRRISRLAGTVEAILPGKVETFRFKGLEKAKDVEQRMADVTVVLDEVRKNNQNWELRVRVRFDDAGEALQSHRNWVFENEAFLEGADGKPVAYSAYETTMQSQREVGVAYLFSIDGPLDAYTFIYKTPGMILNAELDYDLKDIPLP